MDYWSEYADIKLWNWESLSKEIGPEFDQVCEETDSSRYRANFARHWLIYHHGGSYADWDTEPVSDPYREEEWGDKFVIAPHPVVIGHVDNCFLYSKSPNNLVAKKILDNVDFFKLCSRQISILTAFEQKQGLRLRLDLPWNKINDKGVAIIKHYYTGGSYDKKEMKWISERVKDKKVVECGAGLRSIELNDICDLKTVEHQDMYADRVRRGGCEVLLEKDLTKYPKLLANTAQDSEIVLLDGRERVGCLLELAKKDHDPTIYLHDSNRNRYKIPESYRIVEECPESDRGLIALKKN